MREKMCVGGRAKEDGKYWISKSIALLVVQIRVVREHLLSGALVPGKVLSCTKLWGAHRRYGPHIAAKLRASPVDLKT
jgi:hypothetical protein